MFSVYKNILPEDDFLIEYEMIRDSSWTFNNISCKSENAITFWYKNLIEKPYYSEFLFKRIQKLTNKTFELISVNANGQSYGQCGDFHRDALQDDCYTFLIYMNPIWQPNWEGFTIFQENDEIQSYLPVPNSGVLFKSNMLHYGSDPSIYCKQLRISVAFKLKEINNV